MMLSSAVGKIVIRELVQIISSPAENFFMRSFPTSQTLLPRRMVTHSPRRMTRHRRLASKFVPTCAVSRARPLRAGTKLVPLSPST